LAGADQLRSAVRLLRPGTVAKAEIARGEAKRTVEIKIGTEIEKVPRDLPAFHARPSATRKENGGKAAPAPKAEAEKKPRTGLFHDALPGDSAPTYWAYIPDSYSTDDAWGLVVWIAPARDSMEATLLGRWQSLCEERRLILVAPLPAETSGFNPNDLVGARQIVDQFLQKYAWLRGRRALRTGVRLRQPRGDSRTRSGLEPVGRSAAGESPELSVPVLLLLSRHRRSA
jgi:hypothetical protein